MWAIYIAIGLLVAYALIFGACCLGWWLGGEDAADEIVRLRTELGVANQIIYDLTDGITGTLQRDETDRLRGLGQ